jgi:hypothetical protein
MPTCQSIDSRRCLAFVYRKAVTAFTASLIATLLATAPIAPAHAAVPQSQFTCQYLLWPFGSGFSADLVINNSGPTIDGWTVHWTFKEPTQLVSVWSAEMKMPTPNDAIATPLPWTKVIPSGAAVIFGWTAFAAKTEVPTDITVNGQPC